MRELRIEMTFVYDGDANSGDLVKDALFLYSLAKDRYFANPDEDKCRFDVSELVRDESRLLKEYCPHCEKLISGPIYKWEEGEEAEGRVEG